MRRIIRLGKGPREGTLRFFVRGGLSRLHLFHIDTDYGRRIAWSGLCRTRSDKQNEGRTK
jgi:hypothetical protein